MGSIKVNKITAQKLINAGYTIKMLPCKMRFGSLWFEPAYIDKNKLDKWDITFEQFINEYTFYNCNAEQGKYPHYYLSMDFTLDNYTAGCYTYNEAIATYKAVEMRTKE